ncbi:N-6 DNA methylase [Microbacterium neimengense]
MASHTVLDELVDELGYRDGRGYVSGPVGGGPREPIWTDLSGKCGVTAAYFRGAVPVVAFVATDTRDQAHEVQGRLWNYGRVPILIAATPDEVLAFTCNVAQTATNPDAALLARAGVGTTAQVLEDFTRFSVESGRLTANRRLGNDRVDQSLLRNLRFLRKSLLSAGVRPNEIEPLLGRSIFVRYLEDRQILGPRELRELGQPDSFARALAGGWDKVSSFFAAMSDHFSGDVFRTDALSRPLPAAALNVLAQFFQGSSLDTGQTSLWGYDFSIIPAEFLSSIYEQLLVDQQKHDAAYYTPRKVVDLVLDELLPARLGHETPPTILDPACGSGIFLTEAFRRLVRQRTDHTHVPPSYEELSELLKSSIFGIDRNADAIGVTAFGLYLALLEHVDPRTIWRTVRLPQLVDRNLIVSDFFEKNPLSTRRFDVIAGNPPWQSALTPAADRYLLDQTYEVPDKQIAAAFIWKTAEMLAPGGLAGLVLPSKTLLHNQSATANRFRLEFFTSLDVHTVIDLSPLRRTLFGASSPAVVTIYGPQTAEPRPQLLHVSPRRTPISEIVDGIVIPQQNIQRVSRAKACSDSSIWKTLLWGGAQDVALVSYLREGFHTLWDLVKQRKWANGAGYQIRGGREVSAEHLHDLPVLRTGDLRAMRRPTTFQPPVTNTVMHSPRSRQIYLAPHVLMRKGFAKTPVSSFVPDDVSFADGLAAIAGPSEDTSLLAAVAAILDSSVAKYWYFMTSSSWGVEREQLHLKEWLGLPLPELDHSTVSRLAEITRRASEGAAEEEWRAERDRTVEEAYGLNAEERQLLSDALHVRLLELQGGPTSTAYQPPNHREFAEYASALKMHMDRFAMGNWCVQLAERRQDFARVTCTHEQGQPGSASYTVERLVQDDSAVLNEALSSATIVEPHAVILDDEVVHLVKPNRRTVWTASTAALDAADIFSALLTPHEDA